MNRRTWIRLCTPLLALFALSGCILVDDFSPAWEKGQKDSCTNEMAKSLYLSEFRRDPEGKDMNELAHVLVLPDKHYFLMLKKDKSDKGGRMYRFGVINGIFQRYRLNPLMRDTFAIEYPNAPVSIEHDTVRMSTLDEASIKLLTEVAAKADYWEVEDQALYNTLRDPACKYEDRPLSIDANPQPLKPKIIPKAGK